MSRFDVRVWFLALCVELYKEAKEMSGQQAYNFLSENGAIDYITDCADALHATGDKYIVDSIDEYIKAHIKNGCS